MSDVYRLRRGPGASEYLCLAASLRSFAVRFRQSFSGGEAAKSALRLPYEFRRHLRVRRSASPAHFAIFEVIQPLRDHICQEWEHRKIEELRDAAMNCIRAQALEHKGVVESCYHTYRRVSEGAPHQLRSEADSDGEVVPSGALFVELHPQLPESLHPRIFEHFHLLVDRRITYHQGAYVVRVTQETGMNPIRLATRLQELTLPGEEREHLFRYVDPLFHRRRQARMLPTDPLFKYQWHLRNDGVLGGKVGADIAAPEAWDVSRGSPQVTVAVIDDAFDLEHAELGGEGRIVAPLDLSSGSSDVSPTPQSDQWHGTAVLGLIGSAHNGLGGCGIAPKCQLLPIKLEAFLDDEAEARAFDHAVEQGAAVINCSWGPYDDHSQERWPMPRLTELAIERAYRRDVCVVFAAGNGAEDIQTDGYASHPCVIAVSASTDQDRRAAYSDYGDRVWVCAPSSGGSRDIVTLDVRHEGYNPFGSYTTSFGGTSAAAPIVSGVIALMQSAFVERNPGSRLSVEEIRYLLRETAESIDPKGAFFREFWQHKKIAVGYRYREKHSLAYGYGRVHAARAVRAAQEWDRSEGASRLSAFRRIVGTRRRLPDLLDPAPTEALPLTLEELKLPPHHSGDPLSRYHQIRSAHMDQRAFERFEAGEHTWLGSRGFDLALAHYRTPDDFALTANDAPLRRGRGQKGETFSYGELVALSGDFYGSPDDLFNEKPTWHEFLFSSNDLADLKRYFQNEVEAIQEQIRGERFAFPDHNIVFWWNAKHYTELAVDNFRHFAWHNMVTYCEHHGKALELARRAYDLEEGLDDPAEVDYTWRRALFVNAFADHFLTDSFAAGHIRVPRQEIRKWGAKQGLSDRAAGALSKLLHDQDGHIHGYHVQDDHKSIPDDEGLRVKNSLGHEWYTRCDGQLFLAGNPQKPFIQNPLQAVKLSLIELLKARFERAEFNGTYAATQWVPFPHPDAPAFTEKFPPLLPDDELQRLHQSVKWYIKLFEGEAVSASSIRKLWADLPKLMGKFQAAVTDDLLRKPELLSHLPKAYIDAYQKLL